MKRQKPEFFFLLCCMMCQPAFGAFVAPTSWVRPTSESAAAITRTTYQEWDVFFSAQGPNPPDVNSVNPYGVADAFDAAWQQSGAFVTSGGNIYSFAGVINPNVSVPFSGEVSQTVTSVLLQIRTLGSLIETDNLVVGGTPATILPGYSYVERSRQSLSGGFGGFAVEHAWTFNVGSSSAIAVDLLWGVFSASLDRLSVDTRTVVQRPGRPTRLTAEFLAADGPVFSVLRASSIPEPSLGLLLVPLVYLCRRARRPAS